MLGKKYMIFHIQNRKAESLQLMINNTDIEIVQEFIFPGLTLDENLNCNSTVILIKFQIIEVLLIIKNEHSYL